MRAFSVVDTTGRTVETFAHVEDAIAGLRLLGAGSVVRLLDGALLQTRFPVRASRNARVEN